LPRGRLRRPQRCEHTMMKTRQHQMMRYKR
jgi:hypothetical protein